MLDLQGNTTCYEICDNPIIMRKVSDRAHQRRRPRPQIASDSQQVAGRTHCFLEPKLRDAIETIDIRSGFGMF